jgi:hypothetical protein
MILDRHLLLGLYCFYVKIYNEMVNLLSFSNYTLNYYKRQIPSGFIILHQFEIDSSSVLLKEVIIVFIALAAC